MQTGNGLIESTYTCFEIHRNENRDCPSFRNTRQDHFFRYRGIDASAHPVEISMGFQCCNGGLRINRKMETTVAGLFAAGENAGGLHGADRLGGNMLAGCIIS